MEYPTKNMVDAANDEQLFRWRRFLPSPATSYELEVLNMILNKIYGFELTPEMSKKIGWEE